MAAVSYHWHWGSPPYKNWSQYVQQWYTICTVVEAAAIVVVVARLQRKAPRLWVASCIAQRTKGNLELGLALGQHSREAHRDAHEARGYPHSRQLLAAHLAARARARARHQRVVVPEAHRLHGEQSNTQVHKDTYNMMLYRRDLGTLPVMHRGDTAHSTVSHSTVQYSVYWFPAGQMCVNRRVFTGS